MNIIIYPPESRPEKKGLYNVENQYNQTGQSFWNGSEWGEWSGGKGNLMHYGDAYVVKYEYIGEENEPRDTI